MFFNPIVKSRNGNTKRSSSLIDFGALASNADVANDVFGHSLLDNVESFSKTSLAAPESIALAARCAPSTSEWV